MLIVIHDLRVFMDQGFLKKLSEMETKLKTHFSSVFELVPFWVKKFPLPKRKAARFHRFWNFKFKRTERRNELEFYMYR